MRTNELEGAALDWAVAKCEGDAPVKAGGKGLEYSTDWLAGGPIIERERIDLYGSGGWVAECVIEDKVIHAEDPTTLIRVIHAEGRTPLIAAMRCYVATKMGDDVEVPEGI